MARVLFGREFRRAVTLIAHRARLRTSRSGESALLLLDVVDVLDDARHRLRDVAFSRVVEVPFQGERLKFIGREDFIAMKAFAAGPMDVLDATRAINAAGDSLDVELLRRLTKKYGRDALATVERLLAG